MLVSAVVDPAAFDARYFDELYAIHVADFLRGIQRNGLLIVDTGDRLRDSLVTRVKAIPIKYRQQLQILVEELLLKKRSKRIITCLSIPNDTSSGDLLDLAYRLKTDAAADALVVGNKGLEKLISDRRFGEDIVPLSEYRDSDFETNRRRYENPIGPIDTLPKLEVEDILIRSVRFAKWLRFYDPYIGRGDNTDAFREGIEYILSLWSEHGFFASQQGAGSVEIFTCKGRNVHLQHQRIVEKLTKPLEQRFPWQVKYLIKVDKVSSDERIFHARYLEAQHAIIRIDRGFDLFKPSGELKRNFFTLNMAESSHLRDCRDLPDANFDGMS